MKDEKLTSVKITQPLFDEFKIVCLQDNFSFKKLADRAIFLYLTDKEFREKIRKQNTLKIK
jgi:predicted transcriptional regulator